MTRWDADKFDGPTTWDEWTDVLGQTYGAGDLVAIAIINGRSPQLVIGEVLQINRVNSKGQEITDSVWDTPDRHYANNAERIDVQSCTVRVQPIIDARGFGRGWGRSDDEKPRPVTYKIPANIIKVSL